MITASVMKELKAYLLANIMTFSRTLYSKRFKTHLQAKLPTENFVREAGLNCPLPPSPHPRMIHDVEVLLRVMQDVEIHELSKIILRSLHIIST